MRGGFRSFIVALFDHSILLTIHQLETRAMINRFLVPGIISRSRVSRLSEFFISRERERSQVTNSFVSLRLNADPH